MHVCNYFDVMFKHFERLVLEMHYMLAPARGRGQNPICSLHAAVLGQCWVRFPVASAEGVYGS